jgi:hypothetical protein
MKQERYHRNGEMEDNCIKLLSYVCTYPTCETSINQISRQAKIPIGSLYDILSDAKRNKMESSLFIYAVKYGYDFYIFNEWNKCKNQNDRGKVISVVKWEWGDHRYLGVV